MRSRPTSLFVILCALVTIPASAAEPPPLLPEPVVAALASEISGSSALRTIEELALEHRMRGSRGFRAAAETVARRAGSFGLQEVEIWELPADGERFYGTQRSRPAWDVEDAELWELRQEGEVWTRQRRLASWSTRPVSVAQDSVSGEVTTELVDVGVGTSMADYEGLDVAGKLVLTSSQPGAVQALAVGELGAAGIVSWAQNQRTAWWGEDESLVRWGHLGTFTEPATFAFMVSPGEARALSARLAAGESVRLEARVEAGRHAGAYAIATARIPGADPELAGEEIVYSCHLDHQRPGANDNASGCAAILEVGRALAKLVAEGRIPPPRRSLRFIWPPEIEGTIALLVDRPELVESAKAAIHLDMVAGRRDITRSVLRVTRSPKSLPTAASDVAEAFGRWANGQTRLFADSGAAPYPLVDPSGTQDALQAELVSFTAGSDHQVWAEGSFRVPAIYINDWPDRYIHTHRDVAGNLDPTKLGRAAFLAAASGYALATLDTDGAVELLAIARRHALRRSAEVVARAERLRAAGTPAEAENLLRFHDTWERALAKSVERFAMPPDGARRTAASFYDDLARLTGAAELTAAAVGLSSDAAVVYRRATEPKGPMNGFGYSWLEDHLARHEIARPRLLTWPGQWENEPFGASYAEEALNLVDGQRDVSAIRDALAAIFGPVPLEVVAEYLGVLETLGILISPETSAPGTSAAE